MHELSDMLLGKLVSPTLTKLKQELLNEQVARNTEKEAFDTINNGLNQRVKQLIISNDLTKDENRILQEQNEDLQTHNEELQVAYASSQAHMNNLERQLRLYGIYVP